MSASTAPLKLATDAASYDVVTPAPDANDTWSPTVTVHSWPDPTPSTLRHRILVWGDVASTTQSEAVKDRPPPA